MHDTKKDRIRSAISNIGEVKSVPWSQSTTVTKKETSSNGVADLMTFKACAKDASVHPKTIARWAECGYLTEWRPHPDSKTRRIKRAVWEAFKQRRK